MDGYRQGLDNNENKIKNANKMDGWMARHGDGCRYAPENNEYKIKNNIDGWMARHGDGCRYAPDNNEYKIKNDINGWMDGPPWRRIPAGA